MSESAESPFDDLTDIYEAMVDWPRRLAREEPFYRRLFERIGVRSVVDVACGTGHHAAMFHRWSLRVRGTDLSGSMIDRARRTHGEHENLCWMVRGFDQPIEPAGAFDAALCVGNSLALTPKRETAFRAIGRMLAAVRPGGAVVVHLLNLWRLEEGPGLWQKCFRMTLPQGEVLVMKGIHRCGRHGYVDLIVTPLRSPAAYHAESHRLLGLEASELEQAARAAGAVEIVCFGDYEETPYDREKSVDLILVARK